MPQLRATVSGRGNKDARFSPEISVGTYGGGLAHLQTSRQGMWEGGGRHTHTHESPRLPESLTSQSQMPQLSHQYRGVKRRQLPRSPKLLCALYNVRINMHQEGQRQELVLPSFCENMCVRHRSLAARQEATQSAGRVKSAPLLSSFCHRPQTKKKKVRSPGALTCDAPARNATNPCSSRTHPTPPPTSSPAPAMGALPSRLIGFIVDARRGPLSPCPRRPRPPHLRLIYRSKIPLH